VIIDLGRATRFWGFRILPRSDGNPVSNIKAWRFYATNIGPARLGSRSPDVTRLNDAAWQRVSLPHTPRLEPLNAAGGRNYQACAGIAAQLLLLRRPVSNVSLQVLAPLHITDAILAATPAGGGIFVTTPQVSEQRSTVQVRTDVSNQSAQSRRVMVSQEILAPDGSVAARSSQALSIAANARQRSTQALQVLGARLWQPYHPWLYVLHTVVSENGRAVDDEWTRLGIRSVRFDKGVLCTFRTQSGRKVPACAVRR